MTSNDTNDPWVNAMYLSLGMDLARPQTFHKACNILSITYLNFS